MSACRQPGTRVVALEERVNAEKQVRVKIKGGWVSKHSSSGVQLLEEVGSDESARPACAKSRLGLSGTHS